MTFDEIFSLFLPHSVERLNTLRTGKRLVHYTSAEAAYQIITGRQIWLRNAQVMNDFSEIQHGINCLSQAWQSPGGKQVKTMLDQISGGLSNTLEKLFYGHADTFKQGTYITSLSEHEDYEDSYGRLSMWRAYGGKSGVALVLNNTAFTGATQEMNVFSSPVFYQDTEQFVLWFQDWAAKITAAESVLKQLDFKTILETFFKVFRSFALCTKHPGFAEEREWRVYYSPVFEGPSDWVHKSTAIIRGVPQLLMKFDLRDEPERGISGVAPQTLLNRVIIGPCEYPLQVRDAMISALEEVGIKNPHEMMWMSLIPYRH